MGQTPRGQTTPPPGRLVLGIQPPPPRYYGIRSTSGRYASYWNAYVWFRNVHATMVGILSFHVRNVWKGNIVANNVVYEGKKSSVWERMDKGTVLSHSIWITARLDEVLLTRDGCETIAFSVLACFIKETSLPMQKSHDKRTHGLKSHHKDLPKWSILVGRSFNRVAIGKPTQALTGAYPHLGSALCVSSQTIIMKP